MWKDMYCSDEKEYIMRLHMFEQSCVYNKMFVDYVKETCLTPHKEKFVGAWTNRVMHLENTSTNRGSFQKRFYDEVHEHGNPFYHRLNTFVLREAQIHIIEEYEKVEWVSTDKSVCGCSLRRTYELPCACELTQYKLIGKRVLKSKVRELAFPTTSSMCPPLEKVKTKGRVKKSKGKKADGYDPYIYDIFDVVAYRNCGFRAITLLLRHSEESWSLLKMKDRFSMLDIAPGWKQYHTDEATSWAITYTKHLQH
ncbi:uncharacterized protein [Cicer arietinum]|uniref:uncharacterized protein n=1 Tax=Cicer arietinum TaxID=3827 RepID=UPI003CC66C0D